MYHKKIKVMMGMKIKVTMGMKIVAVDLLFLFVWNIIISHLLFIKIIYEII